MTVAAIKPGDGCPRVLHALIVATPKMGVTVRTPVPGLYTR